MSDRLTTVVDSFSAQLGGSPHGVWVAPGRINLIGEHTDYNEGYVLPFAIEQAAWVAASPRADAGWRIVSTETNEQIHLSPDEIAARLPGWHAYLAGVGWALAADGHSVRGLDVVLSSDIPLGAGLSSSAALECATMAAFCDLFGLDIEPMRRAQLARVAENEYVGAPTGLMDQAASTLCTRDHALFLDCRTLEYRQVPLAPEAAGQRLLVIDTRTRHSHVDGEYASRRKACESAALTLGVASLRDVTDLPGALERLEEVQARRVRHVVTENERVLATVAALDTGDTVGIGPLLTASHASMRDDYGITVPSVDLAVETALSEGAVGARMTGGGFGGCVIALCPSDQAGRISEAITDAFARHAFTAPVIFRAQPSAGAHRVA